MNKERLLKLADLLESVPEEKFDMWQWGVAPSGVFYAPTCATAACALGWATAIPEFKAAGLNLEAPYGSCNALVTYRTPYGDSVSNELAGREFFDLTIDQSQSLFMCGMDMSAKEKAAQIREMVANAP